MRDVEAIVYTEKRVYPVYSEGVRRYIPFEECVLMQSTSLKDIHNKNIYVGDIIKYKEYDNRFTYTGIVNYDIDYAVFGLIKKDDEITFADLATENIDLKSLEVVGNIYEDPELLRENEEIVADWKNNETDVSEKMEDTDELAYKITFPGYQISYRPYNGPIVYTDVIEDPECLRMEIDMLLEQYDEVTVRKKS